MVNSRDIPMLNVLQRVAKEVMPVGSQVWLYGSRARGEAHKDSDWDVLILLDKDNNIVGGFERFAEWGLIR